MRRFLRGLLGVLLLSASTVKADEFDPNRYDVYFGDVNGDGYSDYYFHGKDFIILLHGDIITPIVRLAPVSQKLLITHVKPDNQPLIHYDYGVLEVVDPSLSEAQISALNLVKLNLNSDYFVGDFNGDNLNDIVFTQSDRLLTLVGRSGDGVAFESLGSTATGGTYLASSYASRLSVRDANGDGKDDLVYTPTNSFESEEVYSGLTGEHLRSLDTPTLQTAKLHGASGGHFRVDERGGATYTIPLTVPQGTAGVAPSFSLQYSSQGGNGLLGQGWSMSGISMISRCQQTLAQDGGAKAISWSASDRFCFNGQRLKKTGTTSNYREYRTEVDSYVRIRAYGSDEGNPSYFIVDAKDGSRSYYGETSLSRHTLSASGKSDRVYSWALERFADNMDNRILYEYAHESGANFRLQKAYYALGSSNNKADAKAVVEFEYTARPDQSRMFVSGYEMAQNKRLNQIKVSNRETGSLQVIREYNMVYRKSSIDTRFVGSYLTAVQECVSGNNCLPATQFDWEIKRGLSFGAKGNGMEIVDSGSQLENFITFDVDADGDLDIAWMELDQYSGGNNNLKLRYATSQGDHYTYGNFKIDNKDCSGSTELKYDLCDQANSSWWEKVRIQPTDFNGDGRQDIALFRDTANDWQIIPSVPTTTDANGVHWQLSSQKIPVTVTNDPNAAFVDLNSDGLLDILTFDNAYYLERNSNAASSPTPYSYSNTATAVNWNWNGLRQSFLSSMWQQNYPATGFDEVVFSIQKVLSANADFNGDGVSDVIVVEQQIYQFNSTLPDNQDKVIMGQQDHYYAAIRDTSVSGSVKFNVVNYLGGKTIRSPDAELSQLPSSMNFLQQSLWSNLINIQVVDLNEDGLHDIVIERDGGNGVNDTGSYELYLNRGGEFAAPVTIASNIVDIDDATVQFMDRNADGHVDFVLGTKQSSGYYTYTYAAWQPESLNFSSTRSSAGLVSNHESNRLMFYDTNGDSHLDAIEYKDRNLKIALNEESGVNNVVTSITNGLGGVTEISYEPLTRSSHYESIAKQMTSSQTWTEEVCTATAGQGPGGTSVCVNWETQEFTSYDFDTASFYTALIDPFASLKAQTNAGSAQSLADKENLPVMEYLAPVYVVTRVEGSAPVGNASTTGNVDTGATSAIDYFYKRARVQAGGRGFLGFESLSSVDAQSGVETTTQYRQDYPFTGYPTRTTSYIGISGVKKVLTDKTSSWALYGWNTTLRNNYGNNPQSVSLKPYLGNSSETSYTIRNDPAWLPGLIAVTASGSYTAQKVQQTVEIDNTYDAYGNVLEIVTTTAGNNLSLVKTIKNDYDGDNNYSSHNAGTSLTLQNGAVMSYAELGRLTGTKVTTQRGSQTATTRESRFSYHTSGNNAGLLHTETVEPGDAANTLVSTHSYDAFGNEIAVSTVGKNTQYAQNGSVSSSVNQTRQTEVAFDSDGRYVDTTYAVLNSGTRYVTEQVNARNQYGAPSVLSNGLNGTVITIEHDALGRELYREDNTNNDSRGAWSATEYLKCSSALNCPAGTSYVVRKTDASGATSWSYFDVLGRVTRAATQGLDGDEGISKAVYVDTEYDSSGRVLRVSEPYFENTVAQYWTTTQYDPLGRAVIVTGPDSTVSTVSHFGYTTTFKNALNQERTETKNGLGELVRISDAIDGSIEYTYTNRGDLEYMYARNGANTQTITTHLTYDAYGRKTAMNDPDKGAWEYKYNAFGELVWQKDAKGQVVTQTYDTLGRMVSRVDYKSDASVEGSTSWYYDGHTDDSSVIVANAGIGVSAVVLRAASTSGACSATSARQCSYPSYDNYGRNVANAVTYNINGNRETYTTATLFDAIGRVEAQTDVLDGAVLSSNSNDNRYSNNTILSGTQNHYDAYGYLYQVTDLQTGDVIHKIKSVNARGQATQEIRGNGVTSQYQYDSKTGRMTQQQGDLASIFAVQNSNYFWDEVGNLYAHIKAYRDRSLPDSQSPGFGMRVYCYDELNRLVEDVPSGPPNTAEIARERCESSGSTLASYNDFGNITYKKNVGNYTYGGTYGGPHAVTGISNGTQTESFHYDANGNLEADYLGSALNRSFNYSTFDKPTEITRGDHTTLFKYGADRSRYWRQDTDKNGVVTTTTYLGGVEKITKSNEANKVVWKRYLGRTAIITVTTDANLNQLQGSAGYEAVYLYRDQLGSLDVITDAVGTVLQRLSFSPWGERRNPDSWSQVYDTDDLLSNNSALLSGIKEYTTRGFTGHEMVDEVGVIHMNGRIYDPRLARFVQADPIIQAATYTQSLNRYSYVWNNPLNKTDPSGYFAENWDYKAIRGGTKTVAAVVITVVAAYACGGCSIEVYAAVMASAAAAGAIINGAGGQGILRAAVVGGVTGYVGGQLAGAGASVYERAAVMSVVGGVTTSLQGGKFGHGFISGGIGALSGAQVFENAGPVIRVGVVAILGGTVSELTGGKFANGAAYGAFQAAVSEAVLLNGDGGSGDGDVTVQTTDNACELVVVSCTSETRSTGHYQSETTVTADVSNLRALQVIDAVTMVWGIGGAVKFMFKKAALKWIVSRQSARYLSPGVGAAVRGQLFKHAWIQKDLYKQLPKLVGKADFKKFQQALNKGVVGPTNESGIKILRGEVNGFTHELKIAGSAQRLLGKIGDDGVLVFEKFVRGGFH